MNKTVLIAAMTAALAIPATSNAFEVIGKKLEIYGKIHVSVDASDNDKSGEDAQDDLSVSSNSSRLGFKGKHKIADGDMAVIYKLEQEVNVSSKGGEFATRNAYVGLKGSFGKVIVGHHDTPFKDVASKWGVFGDSVGERRSILGASATKGNKMNQRGRNAIMYSNKFNNLKVSAMYSADSLDENADEDSTAGVQDNNDLDMKSIGIMYMGKDVPFYLGAAYEDWSNLDGLGEVDGFRVMGGYKFGFGKVGVIYESISSSDHEEIDRKAYGVNGVFKMGSGLDLRAQVLVADDNAADDDSGATRTSLGVFKKLDKQTQVYAAYGATDNDANAKYQGVDGGHGDEVKTEEGANPSAFSLGLVYKF